MHMNGSTNRYKHQRNYSRKPDEMKMCRSDPSLISANYSSCVTSILQNNGFVSRVESPLPVLPEDMGDYGHVEVPTKQTSSVTVSELQMEGVQEAAKEEEDKPPTEDTPPTVVAPEVTPETTPEVANEMPKRRVAVPRTQELDTIQEWNSDSEDVEEITRPDSKLLAKLLAESVPLELCNRQSNIKLVIVNTNRIAYLIERLQNIFTWSNMRRMCKCRSPRFKDFQVKQTNIVLSLPPRDYEHICSTCDMRTSGALFAQGSSAILFLFAALGFISLFVLSYIYKRDIFLFRSLISYISYATRPRTLSFFGKLLELFK